MAGVISEVGFLGSEIHYFELPHRNDFKTDGNALTGFLANQYRNLCEKLEISLGQKFSTERFAKTVEKVNRLRRLIKEIKTICAESELNPMGASEMLNIEFSALSYYGDLDECILLMEDIRTEMSTRRRNRTGYSRQDLRIVWVTPTADLLLLNYAEELGGRIVGTEYLINQTTPMFRTGCDPFISLAEAQTQSSLMGSSEYRVKLVLDQVQSCRADGVIISGIFGSSHCPYETAPIIDELRSREIPVLAFDVVAPGKKRLQSQILNRMSAFMESLQMRRRVHVG